MARSLAAFCFVLSVSSALAAHAEEPIDPKPIELAPLGHPLDHTTTCMLNPQSWFCTYRPAPGFGLPVDQPKFMPDPDGYQAASVEMFANALYGATALTGFVWGALGLIGTVAGISMLATDDDVKAGPVVLTAVGGVALVSGAVMVGVGIAGLERDKPTGMSFVVGGRY